MARKKEVWNRECKKCGKIFVAFSKFSIVCPLCKEENSRKRKNQ